MTGLCTNMLVLGDISIRDDTQKKFFFMFVTAPELLRQRKSKEKFTKKT